MVATIQTVSLGHVQNIIRKQLLMPKGVAARGQVLAKLISRWKLLKPGLSPLMKTFVLAPANIGGNHWVLLVAIPKRRKIVVMDSMSGSRTRTGKSSMQKYRQSIDALVSVLAAVEVTEAERSGDSDVELQEWSVVSGTCPQQKNGDDCGVYTCMAMIGICMSGDGETVHEWAVEQKTVEHVRLAIGSTIVGMGFSMDELELGMVREEQVAKVRNLRKRATS
jgi:hypothetical protein